MDENVPNFKKDMIIYIQNAKGTPSKQNSERNPHKYTL